LAVNQVISGEYSAEEALNMANTDIRKILEESGYYDKK
jgi:hypothetical protein